MKRLMFLLALFLLGCGGPAAEQTMNSDTAPAESPPAVVPAAVADNGELDVSEPDGSQVDAAEPLVGEPAPTAHLESQTAPEVAARRIDPETLIYRGAFRLPAVSGDSNWEYSGYAMTYFPEGDPEGPDDGYPGSLFAVGHDHQQMVSEISIPAPVISETKDPRELSTAATLQPFADIRGGLVGELEIPRAGLEYLPSSDATRPGKLHFCWGQHFQFERDPSHGWCDLTLASPHPQGLWKLDDFTNYVANDYLFQIPSAWAERNLPGYRLATGRFRDGRWGGLGPALLAYAPPDESNPPTAGATIEKVKTLLMYGAPQAGVAELEVNDARRMKGFSESDEWSGGAWLTAGEAAAVILVGTKATGKTWYGFANGVVYPTSGDPSEAIPEVPPFPYDARGWWSEGVSAQMLFYDPAQLAAVASGAMQPWEPQPYATLAIDKQLFEPGYDHVRQKRYLVGACALDQARGILYVVERQVKQDEERSLIHVFQIKG
ncbi:MAG: hypothetical protein RIC55_02075 [Pirellulaceae bacterium]